MYTCDERPMYISHIYVHGYGTHWKKLFCLIIEKFACLLNDPRKIIEWPTYNVWQKYFLYFKLKSVWLNWISTSDNDNFLLTFFKKKVIAWTSGHFMYLSNLW